MRFAVYSVILSFLLTGISCSQKPAESAEKTPSAPAANTSATPSESESTTVSGSVYDFKVKDIDGKEVNLADYKGKVLVFVNVASECGFTGQYKGIEEFYKTHKDKGVVVLGFPANNFGGQEPGSESEIKQFCTSKYNVTFPMFSKISVKGDDIHPLYKFLTGAVKQDISWNFNKILVDKSGKPVKAFKSSVKVSEEEFLKEVKSLL